MKLTSTPIEDLLLLEPAIFEDERGYFYESFNESRFNAALFEHHQCPVHFVQDNQSLSKRGVLRGLHYQVAPFAQGKLVRVTQGSVWDVALDLRKASKTFGQWFGLELSAANQKQLWIPPGFAHGFIALEDETQFLYKTTAYYDRASERAILWNDAQLAISWSAPSLEDIGTPLVNDKDKSASSFAAAQYF